MMKLANRESKQSPAQTLRSGDSAARPTANILHEYEDITCDCAAEQLAESQGYSGGFNCPGV